MGSFPFHTPIAKLPYELLIIGQLQRPRTVEGIILELPCIVYPIREGCRSVFEVLLHHLTVSQPALPVNKVPRPIPRVDLTVLELKSAELTNFYPNPSLRLFLNSPSNTNPSE